MELTFKVIKENLRCKGSVGTSANALQIQIWTAQLDFLLVRYLQLRTKPAWRQYRFIARLRQQLFVNQDFLGFLDHPFQEPRSPEA
jgi:hypothetical protein